MTRHFKHLAAGAILAGTTALPLAAQDLCGGVGATGIWIGGDEASSDIATAEAFREQLALVLLNNQYVSLFSLSAPTSVRMEAAGQNGDTLIELYDAEGGFVGTDDDGGGGVDSRLEVDLDPGTYCLAVMSFDGAPLTGTVRIGRTDQEALTVGTGDGGGVGEIDGGFGCTSADFIPDDALTAAMLESGVTSTASANQVPYFRFELSEPAALTLTASNQAADPVIALYDATGALIGENDDFTGLDSRLDVVQPLEPGEYCVGIRALSDPDVPIVVEMTAYDQQSARAALYDQGETAPPLDGSYPVTDIGTIAARTRADVQIDGTRAEWLAMSVDDSGLLLIEAIAPDNDPVIELFDDLGRSVAYNDDYGGTYDSQIAVRVTPGTYLLSVRDISEGTPLIRVVVERYVPAP